MESGQSPQNNGPESTLDLTRHPLHIPYTSFTKSAHPNIRAASILFENPELMKEQERRVETIEDFKLRIAAIIHAKLEEIPGPPQKVGDQSESKTSKDLSLGLIV